MKFTIGFDRSDAKKLHGHWDEIIETQKWSEGKFTTLFEEKWSAHNNLPSVSFSSWGGAALAALEFFNIKGKTVLCPSNTFMATPLSVIKAGGNVEFVDCNKDDLCLSFADLQNKIKLHNPAAVWIVHIGGHIAFQINEIAKYCKDKGIILIEDCAHAHGAEWNEKKPGEWGDAGIYSFYATKTISTGEGGMLVTKNAALVDFAKKYRNYGKFDYKVEGLNYRMSEFTAALGCVQADRLKDIIAWKNDYARNFLDRNSQRGFYYQRDDLSYYKYIIFEPIEESTGKVYDQPCHRIMNKEYALPNTDWISQNHWCPPLYYKGEEQL